MADRDATVMPGTAQIDSGLLQCSSPITLPATSLSPLPTVAGSISFAWAATARRSAHVASGFSAEIREIIGAWLVCVALAAGSLTFLGATAPAHHSWPGALISLDPIATVAGAEVNYGQAYRTETHRYRRC